MATNRSEQRLLRTTDLTLSAYLIVEGFTPELVEATDEVRDGHPKGAWEFAESPALRRCVEEFNDGEATVEPRAFHAKVNETRRDMFSFLGIGKPEKG